MDQFSHESAASVPNTFGLMMLRMRIAILSAALAASFVPAAAAQSPDATVRGLLDGPKFKQATAFIQSDQDRFVRELIALTEIPAPPFKEQARAKAYMEMLRQVGLADVEMDPEGNVTGIRRGTAPAGGPLLLVNAHLDTVFPEGTDVKVKRQGTRLMAPGNGDDTRGLALILALVRTLDAAKFTTAGDILFAGNVGEEGEGDLRGIKFLLKTGKYKGRITQVVAIDGNESNGITRGGLGSRRYRVTFKGPGGHSYGAFGLVNPAFAMGGAIAKFARLEVPTKPKTTFNVGVVRGGTSINSIPAEVSMDVDMRSEACSELNRLDQEFLAVVAQAVDEENRTRSTKEGRLEADPKVIGERPCGETAMDARIVQTAAAAVKAFGLTPVFSISSTDANIPMSLGIPAVTIGHGGPGGRQHAPDEWADLDPAANVKNVQVALATILAVAGGG
jgi:acetylornithine deacetylase/succinyl-diaminopimelate desuccinylase-like protein